LPQARTSTNRLPTSNGQQQGLEPKPQINTIECAARDVNGLWFLYS
jgi:hypothetical protein